MQEYNLYSVFSEFFRPPAGYSLRAQNSAVQQKLDHKETLNKKENNSPTLVLVQKRKNLISDGCFS